MMALGVGNTCDDDDDDDDKRQWQPFVIGGQ